MYIPEVCERSVRICYSCDDASAGQDYQLTIGQVGAIKAKTLAGPVGFDEFYTRHLGKVKFPKEGIYAVKIAPVGKVKGDLFGLNWVFIE